jgi:hypothetical protein
MKNKNKIDCKLCEHYDPWQKLSDLLVHPCDYRCIHMNNIPDNKLKDHYKEKKEK